MSLEITVGAVTATTAALTLAGRTGVQPELQIAETPDFAYCVNPRFLVPASNSQALVGLNQSATLYIRGRNLLTSGGSHDAWGATKAFRTPEAAARDLTPSAIRIDTAIIVLPSPVLAISAGNVVSGHPVENLLRDAPVAWHSLHASAHWVRARLGGDPIDTVALLQTNIPESGTIRIRGANDAAQFAANTAPFEVNYPAFRASANMPGRPGYHGLFRLPSPQSYDFWQIDIACAATGSVLHVEHLVLGLNRPTRAHSLDKKDSPINLGGSERTRSGQPDRIKGMKMRRVEFDISMLTEREFETQYSDLWRAIADPVLVVPNSKDGPYLHDRILYGDFAGGSESQPASTRYARSFTIESLI